jgi:hypothetical protein
LLELGRNISFGLSQDAYKLSGLFRVLGGEIGVGDTGVTCSTSSTDSVDVVFTVVGEIVVDNILDVLDV